MDDASQERGRRFNAILTVTGVLLLIAAGTLLLLNTLASRKAVLARVGWDETLGPRREILERYPRSEANPSALAAERLSAAVGIDLATRGFEGRAHPEPGRVAGFREVKPTIGDYLKRHLERPSRRADPPPPEMAAFLQTRSNELAAMRRHLSTAEIPRWEMQLEKAHAAPIPNLLGQIDLQKLLLADAIARNAEGDREGALERLGASWRLNRALRDHPILIVQLVSISIARMQAGALRLIDDPPAEWIGRLTEHDFRDSFVKALMYEGWHWTQITDRIPPGNESQLSGRVLSKLVKPYYDYCLADVSDTFRKRLVNLARVDALCDADLATRGADLDLEIPRWNVIGRIMVPRLAESVHRVARLELDLELTRKVLELEQARRANDGVWPDPAPAPEHSVACPRDRWVYGTTGDGGMTVALDREISWPGQKGAILPTRFSVGGP